MAKGKNKAVKISEPVTGSKTPKNIEDPESFYSKFPVWAFNYLDNNYDKWGFVYSQNTDDINDLICKLKSFEGMTWSQIIKATGGRTHGNNNHFVDIGNLCPEAQERWKTLHLEEYDQVFSLRLTGTNRLYGILRDGVFRIVWFDPKHEIYPLSK